MPALGAKNGLLPISAKLSNGISISPSAAIQAVNTVPCFSRSHFFATAPAATIGAVNRADARPPPRGSRRPYLRQ